jgi:hypothetical protein
MRADTRSQPRITSEAPGDARTPPPPTGAEPHGRFGRTVSFAGPAAAGALAALAALHAVWATGSAWPARDRRRLAQLVAGAEEMPGRAQCTAVACALATSSALVGGLAGKGSIARAARGIICGAFLVRGAAGLTGNTRRLVSWTPAPEFVRRDRRCYGPLCLSIGVAVATTLTPSHTPASTQSPSTSPATSR